MAKQVFQKSQSNFPYVQEIIEHFRRLHPNDYWKRLVEHPWYHGLAIPLFSKIMAKTMYIREGKSTAWIFEKKVPAEVFNEVVVDPDLLSHTAIYDLSPLYEGKRECSKVDKTESVVFLNFEEFLKANYDIRFIELTPHLMEQFILRG